MEEIQEERREHVVAVVAERDPGGAELARDAVKNPAPQPRAERAHRAALGNHALHHRVGVLLDDLEWHAARFEVPGKHVLGKPGLLLVEVHRDQLEAHRRLFLQRQEHVEHAVRILAAGKAHHHAVAFLDHLEVGDRLADLAANALGELSFLVGFLARIAQMDGLRFHAGGQFTAK